MSLEFWGPRISRTSVTSVALVAVALGALSQGAAAEAVAQDARVGVYANHLGTCNFNHATGNVLCVTAASGIQTEYHQVRQLASCDYHHCVTFVDDARRLVCSGYVWLLVGGAMDTYLNPLSPHALAEGLEPTTLVEPFLGYNILIDRFESAVETLFERDIDDVACANPYTTCVHAGNATSCFGLGNLNLHTALESFVLGFVVPGLIAFAVYAARPLLCCRFLRGNPMCTFFFVPLMVFLATMLILFKAERFIVKTKLFFIGTFFGIVAGFMSACAMPHAGPVMEVGEEAAALTVDDDDDDGAKGPRFSIDVSDDASSVDLDDENDFRSDDEECDHANMRLAMSI